MSAENIYGYWEIDGELLYQKTVAIINFFHTRLVGSVVLTSAGRHL